MAGVGPEWVHVRQGGVTTNSVAGEAALDFIFWPSKKRRFGWYFEPGYEYGFGRAHGAVGRPKRRSAYRYPLALIARVEAAVSSLMFCPMNDLTTFRGIMHL
jgi:hypothetical protein